MILFLFITCLISNKIQSQTYKPYPIPSFNVVVQDPASFQESSCSTVKAKKEIKITVKPGCLTDSTSCFATVIVYSLDHQTILGPFQVNCGETLTIPIDEREWGVLVTSDTPVVVSVWIEEPIMKIKNDSPFNDLL